ncbi:MAG: SDR family NAD(P)-dependent oxidoreductase, partial [Deltaproteobacteria bacterium]|nr:SDR family NAD(P)-dependent oxidoreductase [Deltaproteobacteria bacterium]
MASNARMEGKVAIVTGSARGTGATIARLFAEHGARVVVADVNAEGGESVAKEIGDAAIFVETDVTSEDSWANTVERAESHFGSLNVLVNNAAILHLASVEDTKAA